MTRLRYRQRGQRHGLTSDGCIGRRTGSRKVRSGERANPLDLGKTVNHAIARRILCESDKQPVALHKEDLYLQLRSEKSSRLIIFAIDTSDSMGDGPGGRMSAAFGAIVSLAATAYLNRDLVSLITFRDCEATLVVPPTSSVTLIRQKLNRLPVGGATPLTAGLQKAHQVIRQEKHKNPMLETMLVLISDGKATTALQQGMDPDEEALAMARRLSNEGTTSLVIDTVSINRTNHMNRLAEALGGSCHRLHNLQAKQVVKLIQESEPSSI